MQKYLLIAQISSYGRLSAGELYVPLTTANMFVEACSIADIAIIGIDFFHVEERYIIPVSPINGLDCSTFLEKNTPWDNIVKKCNEAAMRDLLLEERRDATQWYNPTLFERSEWEQSELNP